MTQTSTDLTELLLRWQHGDAASLDRLLPFVYADLRQIAVSALRGPQAHVTLQPTALINDVFVRLLGAQSVDISNQAFLCHGRKINAANPD